MGAWAGQTVTGLYLGVWAILALCVVGVIGYGAWQFWRGMQAAMVSVYGSWRRRQVRVRAPAPLLFKRINTKADQKGNSRVH